MSILDKPDFMRKNGTCFFLFNSSCIVKIALFICCYLITGTHANAQWQWLNPRPSGYGINKIVFTNHATGYILNSNGDLYKTTNTGISWQQTGTFPKALCMDIKDSTGVIAGFQGTVYISSDNGDSWQEIKTGIVDGFETVNIVSRDTFFLSNSYNNSYGNSGNIYETTDRGKTWINLTCGTSIHSITFVNSKTGFVGGPQSTILKTEDGGVTWQQRRQVNFIPSGVEAIQFLNKDTGYACMEYDSLLTTYDGGNTWQSSNTYETMGTMDFVSSTDGYVGGEDGALYATHDGGKTFTWAGFDGLRDGNTIYSLCFLSKDTGFAVGLLGRIMKTTNAGKSWVAYSPTYLPITAVSFGADSTGYATNWNNIYKTKDKGKTWNVLGLTTGTQYPSRSRFEQAYFISADTGFVTSSYPAQVHSTFDGGTTWDTNYPTPAAYDQVNDMQFLNARTGFMAVTTGSAGFQGSIVKTKDGGITWKTVWEAQYMGEGFRHIFYVSEDTGYAISYNQLFKTTDGSQTWTLVFTSQYFYELTSVCFITSQKGFVTDSDDNIIRTNDGGKTWINSRLSDFSSIVTGDIKTLKFYNGQIGYLTTGYISGPVNSGAIYQTTDSGITWQLKKNVGGNSILFTKDTSIIIAGYGGSILKSKIKEAYVDSLEINNINCTNTLSAIVTSVLSLADSISFEITAKSGTTISIPAAPSYSDNKKVTCNASVNSLIADSSYTIRVKYLYEGNYAYSKPVSFIAAGLAVPTIKKSGNALISDYLTGNQWYRNDTLINGATQQSYLLPDYITFKQCYTVKETNSNGCSSVSDTLCIDTISIPEQPSLLIKSVYTSNGVLLTWQTASELNSDYFGIEKSANGIDFDAIGSVQASGNSNTTKYYSFTDSVTQGVNNIILFYRVKMLYKNGSFTYSKIASITIPKKTGKLNIAPNPATTYAIIYFKQIETDATISVFDEFGRKVFSDSFKGAAHTTYQIQTAHLVAGIYSVTVLTNQDKYSGRLIIIK